MFDFARSDDDDGGTSSRVASRIGTGTGSELRRPLGIAVIGGLIVSRVLTLYTTAVVYLILSNVSRTGGTLAVGGTSRPIQPGTSHSETIAGYSGA